MASRESQGLQIALIIFVMVTVVLAVTTFVFYRRAEEMKKTAAAANEQKKAAETGLREENDKVQYLKHILGAGTPLAEEEFRVVQTSILGDEDMKTIDDAYNQHMDTYGEALPPDSPKNYITLLPNLLIALRDRNVAHTNLSAELTKVNDEKQNLQQGEEKRTGEAIAGLQKAKDDLAGQTQTFKDVRDDLNKKKQDQLTTFIARLKTQTDEVAAANAEKQAVLDSNKKLLDTIDLLKDKLELFEDEPFEVADGQIVRVNQGAKTVWINLGTADGLRHQTLFSVYDKDANGIAEPDRKASIEVTRVLDDHLAEARINYDQASNPIMSHDQVFSPAWQPGRSVHFALAGFLDINGDRRSDRELVKNVIRSSGGVIDADVPEVGPPTGSLTSNTRYLVMGEAPAAKDNAEALTAWNQILDSAKEYGIPSITPQMLLSWMGYRTEVRSVPLGARARSEDFQFAPAEGKARTSTGEVSDVFRDRAPPARGAGDSTF